MSEISEGMLTLITAFGKDVKSLSELLHTLEWNGLIEMDHLAQDIIWADNGENQFGKNSAFSSVEEYKKGTSLFIAKKKQARKLGILEKIHELELKKSSKHEDIRSIEAEVKELDQIKLQLKKELEALEQDK